MPRVRPVLFPHAFSSSQIPEIGHLQGVLTHLHDFDPVAVGVVRPALQIAVAALVHVRVEGIARFPDAVGRPPDIAGEQAEVVAADPPRFLRAAGDCVKQLDELRPARVDVDDPRPARGIGEIERFFESERFAPERERRLHVRDRVRGVRESQHDVRGVFRFHLDLLSGARSALRSAPVPPCAADPADRFDDSIISRIGE